MPESVLLVHPDATIAEGIQKALLANGFEVAVVPDGERAIDRFVQSPFEVLIVEMVLPGRDGAATAESIRWAPEGDDATVILLGTRGSAEQALAAAAQRVGASATFDRIPSGEILTRAIALARNTFKTEPNARRLQLELGPSIDGSTHTTRKLEGFGAGPDESISGSWSKGDNPTAEQEGRRLVNFDETTENAFEGSLSRTPFPRLLWQIGAMRTSGILVLENPTDQRRTTTDTRAKKAVHFRLGVPVYIESNLVQECLGRVLVRSGRISHRQLDESVRRMRAGEGKQGTVLITMGVLRGSDLRSALSDQLQVKLFDLFTWEQGPFRFVSENPRVDRAVILDLEPAQVIYQGVLRRVSPTRIMHALSSHLGQFATVLEGAAAPFRNLELPVAARSLFDSLNGTETVADTLEHAGENRGAVAQLLYALHSAQAVEFASSRSSEAAQSRRGSARAPAGPASHPWTLGGLREELNRMGRLLRAEEYEAAVGANHTPQQLREVTGRLSRRYRIAAEDQSVPRDLRALAYEVCARLVHAERALKGEPRKTTAPGTVITRQDPPEQGLSEPGSAEVGKGATATAPTIRRLPMETDLAVSKNAAPALEVPDDLDARVQRLYQAERHFRRGEVALTRSRLDAAISAFGRATELCPDEGEFLAYRSFATYLARCEAGETQSSAAKCVVEELENSAVLAPNKEAVHLFRARVLLALGDQRAARDSYATALAINPDSAEAKKWLTSSADS